MRRATAVVGAIFVMAAVYLVGWFFARHMVEGIGLWAEIGGHVTVVLIAGVAGASSYRATMGWSAPSG